MTTDTLVSLISKTFIARGDVKAVQQRDGAYHPDRTKFTFGDMRAHLDGTKTFGHYLLSTESQCKLFCLDIDLIKDGGGWFLEDGSWVDATPENGGCRAAWAAGAEHPARPYLLGSLRSLAEGLAYRIKRLLEINVAVAYSGNKGVHVYGLTGLIPAAEARGAAVDLLDSWGCFEAVRGDNFYRHTPWGDRQGYPSLEIEVFPKQDSLEGKDLGNLLRLPLGINQKSQQRAYFIDLGCPPPPTEFPEADPVKVLDPAGYSW